MSMFFVYAIVNPKGKIYIGQTADLEKRIARHNQKLPSKSSSYTHKQGGEWSCFYQEKLETREMARLREKQLKSYQGRLFLKQILSSSG